jgi:substrate import-associated zinc metallohydrolase lipoprotein
MKLYKIVLFFFALVALASCDKEDDLVVDDISGLGGDTWTPGAIDKWITDSLTTPYNISAKYKWDQSELPLDRSLVPPREDKVIPVLSSIRRAWINPYIAEAGDVFFKKYAPKFFALVGSASFNQDGTIVLGTAEGGRKVVLYVLNDFRIKGMTGFRPSDSSNIKRMFHTIHHEFAHILHQNVMYPEDYKRISVGLYTANWNNVSTAEARFTGFITPYSMSGPDEDFVEMIATMLVEGKTGFDAIINSIADAEARSILRQKEAMVVTYFKQVWNVDFYRLQARTRASIETMIK